MKKTIPFLVLTSSLLLLLSACGKKAENVTLASEQDTLSWAMGMSLAETMKSGFYTFNTDIVEQALQSALKGEAQPLDSDTYQAACQYLAFLAQKQQRDEMKKAAQQSAANETEIFERIVKENPGLKKAPEGYYYQVVREGKGPKAKVGQRIRFDFSSVNLFTGQEYASSYNRPKTPDMPDGIVHVLGKPMIPGMQEGLQLMNAGSKYIFYFPSQLAFGAQGSDGLAPYTPLKYEIELHDIYLD